MKILHTGDWHLRDADIEEAEKCLAFLIGTAKHEAVDLIIVAGDTFDSRDLKLDSKAAKLAVGTFSALAHICPVAVILGTPSHDGMAAEILSFVRGHFPIHVATKPEQIFLQKGIGFVDIEDAIMGCDAVISLIPAPTKQFFQGNGDIKQGDAEIAAAMTAIFAGMGATASGFDCPHVLVYHGGISGARLPSGHVRTGMDIEISTDQMRMAGGARDFIGAFYSGPIYPVKVDEQECGFWIHEIGANDFIGLLGHIHQPQILGAYGDESKSRYIETPITKTVRIKVDATDEEAGIFNETVPDMVGADVRYEITTWQDQAGDIDKAGIEKLFLDAGALSVDIRINPIPRENIRAQAVLEAETLRGEFEEMAKLRGEEIDPEILAMADRLEHVPGEELLKEVAA